MSGDAALTRPTTTTAIKKPAEAGFFDTGQRPVITLQNLADGIRVTGCIDIPSNWRRYEWTSVVST